MNDVTTCLADQSALPVGRYEHYKGGHYQVLGTARHSETEEWMVVYQTLYGDHSFWVRPLSMFVEPVTWQGETRPRFRYVDEQTTENAD